MPQYTQLFAERLAYGRIDIVVQSPERGPKCVNPDILVKECGVVQGDALETLQIRRELVELGKAPTTLLLDADLDIANPAALQLDALGNDLLLQPRIQSAALSTQITEPPTVR